MQEPTTWQELLKTLIAKPQARARLATAIHVRSITLQRWADGVSRPRVESLRLLLKHIHRENYQLFMRLLLLDFPELLRDEVFEDSFLPEIPAEFYARVLNNRALASLSIYCLSMQDLILQQMLGHLDPEQRGLSITLVVCVPPRRESKVRTLHEVDGLATPPWPRELIERPAFLGSESLIGYAIACGHPCIINTCDEITTYPVQWGEHERSKAAFPILRHTKAVGGLLISSTQEHFFTQPRVWVLEDYANLATCIFELDEAFPLDQIALRMMSPYELQRPYFAGYHQRIARKLSQASSPREPVTWHRARQLVWQDLEDIVLQVLAQTESERLL